VASSHKLEVVAFSAALFAAGLLGIWGTRAAADCVMEEVRSRTWDAQRMSAIGPWAMTWGKLLGSAAFAWYGGLMALVAVVLAAPRDWTHPPAKVALLMVAGALLAHGAACIAGLTAARKGVTRQGLLGALLVLALLMVIGPVSGFMSTSQQPIGWWQQRYAAIDFVLASAACFAAWAVFGVYRLMCAELQVRTTPWAFAAFALFFTGYLAGFWDGVGASPARARDALLVCGMLVCASLTYLMLFSEQTGVVVLRRVQVRLQRGEWRRALEELPCWPVGLALTGLFCALAVTLLPSQAPAGTAARIVASAPLTLFLLVARDIGIFLFFALARQPRRVEAATLFYCFLLYAVLPWLLRGAGMGGLAELVLPPMVDAPVKAAIVAAAHAAIAAACVTWRWRAAARPQPPRASS
jgi:hypothetical protein